MPGDVPAAALRGSALAAQLSLQPGQRLLTRRARILLAAGALVSGAVASGVAMIVVLAETTWGHARLGTMIERRVAAQLAAGAQLRIGRLDGGLRRAWSAESVVLADATGRTVVLIERASIGIAIPALARGELRLGFVELDGVRVSLDRDLRGAWNFDRLFRAAGPPTSATGPGALVVADSIELRNGTIEISMADSGASAPADRRTISRIRLALGATILSSPDSSGGATTLRALAMAVERPAIRLIAAKGAFRWWTDSARFALSEIRLPGSVAGVAGTIGWPESGNVRVALDVRADSIALADFAWVSPRLPRDGLARARIAVATGSDSAVRFDVRSAEVMVRGSRLSGAGTFVAGPRPSAHDVRVVIERLDVGLLRDLLGDTVVAPVWRGVLDARIAARGGPLDRFVFDSVDVAFADARQAGARSRLRASGAVDASGAAARFIATRVVVDTLIVRTLGAIAPAADSLHGILRGTVTLDGRAAAAQLSALRMQHVDGDNARSTISGSGFLSANRTGRWLDASLVLDTLALATLTRGLTPIALRGAPGGAVTISGAGDTLSIAATLVDSGASASIAATVLLDAAGSKLDLSATFSALNPAAYVARREVPAASLTGRLMAAFDGRNARAEERRVTIDLDSTSSIGSSRLRAGTVRAGIDDDGVRFDTLDLRAATWAVSGRGRLTGDSARTDTLTFSAVIDSLGALRTILLDSAGAPLAGDPEGRLRVENGLVTGSWASAALRADFGAQAVRVGSTAVALATGTVNLHGLPGRTTGTARATLASVTSGAMTVDTATAVATFADGARANVVARAVVGEGTDIGGAAVVTWPDSTYVVRLDSLVASVHGNPWRLTTPATVRARGGLVAVDSLVVRSDRGAVISLAGGLTGTDSVRARARLSHFGLDEVAFLKFLPPAMHGVIDATATVSGTRDAPVVSLVATVDSVISQDRARPSLAVTAGYADRRATVAADATIAGRRVLDARGDIPVNLTLRDVENRILDAPMSLRLVTDSLTLADFEGLVPYVRNLAGSVDGTVDVGGSLRRPRGRGTLSLTNGALEIPRKGFAAQAVAAELELAGDSVIVHRLRMADTESPRDTAALSGVVRFAGTHWTDWTVDARSVAHNFRVIDDPRLATAEADWQLRVGGTLDEPLVTGDVRLPYAVFTIGRQRRAPPLTAAGARHRTPGTPTVSGVVVSLGSDVRLRSREANVQLTGNVELFGPIDYPWISGLVVATRGTYRVNLNVIQRTFRVDSGLVIVEGTPDISPALDIYASYLVKRPDNDDVTISAHVYGTTDHPRLDLTSDLGSAIGDSEIISYLVFGQPSFSVPRTSQSAARTATAALVPSIGGVLEGVLGTVLPFFSTLQVTSVSGDESQNIVSSPIDGLLNNNYAMTGGRQIGSDSFFSVTAGRCSAGRLGATGSSPIWFGAAAEYRPKRTVGAAITIDPGSAPCSRVGGSGDNYQIGFDLSYAWRLGRRP